MLFLLSRNTEFQWYRTTNLIDVSSSKCLFVSAATRSARGHSHVPRRSSRKPICSLSESMRSSCRKEWDSKVVFSDKPSSSDSGKKLLNGANTNCNFCAEGEREGHTKEIRILLQKHNFYSPHQQKQISVAYYYHSSYSFSSLLV